MMSHTGEDAVLSPIHWIGTQQPENVADLARHLVHCRRASLMLPDAQTDNLHLVASSGFAPDVPAGRSSDFGRPVADHVRRTGRALLINGGQPFANLVGQRGHGYASSSFVSVPIQAEQESYGVLSVADPLGRDTFGDENLRAMQELAQLIGQHLATATLRARLAAAEARIAAMQREIAWLQESERSRLARDLHDEAGHALTLAVFHLDLERLKTPAHPGVQDALLRAREALLGCSSALSEMAFRLRPRILEDLGLIPAIRALVAQAGASGEVRVELRVDGQERALGQAMELTVFRMVQEALTNVRKHAQADTAWVELAFRDDALQIVVEDNGIGLASDDAFAGEYSSQGLRGMRERIDAQGGALEIVPRLWRGTCLRAQFPLSLRS